MARIGKESNRHESSTHSDDDEVEPAPGVGEVLFKPVGGPLDEHLEDEDDSEDLVEHLERHLERRAERQVHVLDRLSEKRRQEAPR